MGKFVFIYDGDGGSPEDVTEEQMASIMKAWEDWYTAMGTVTDPGNIFGQTRTVHPDGSVTPDATMSGYTIIEAADIDAAVAHAKAGPHFEAGGTIIIAETLDM
jgi:hypothetical protein